MNYLESKNNNQKRFISVAPMMKVSDRVARLMWRAFSDEIILYSEMIPSAAAANDRGLAHYESENPPILQLGGSDIDYLQRAIKKAEKYNYQKINLNCGCPSPKVKRGAFGAIMMLEPLRTAEILKAMKAVSNNIELSVKCRLGVDDFNDYEFCSRFIEAISRVGIKHIILHARACLISKLSPKKNLIIPKLNYQLALKLKNNFSNLTFGINGGINNFEKINSLFSQGYEEVMLGRIIRDNPWLLCFIDSYFKYNKFICLKEFEQKFEKLWQIQFDYEIDQKIYYSNLARYCCNFANSKALRQACHSNSNINVDEIYQQLSANLGEIYYHNLNYLTATDSKLLNQN